ISITLFLQSGKGYKAISKALGLQRTTVRAVIHKWRTFGTVVNLHRSGRPTKITPRAQRRLIQEVTKEPTTTSKELQASLASVKVSVHDSTIRKTLGKNGIHGPSSKAKTTADQKEHKGSSHFWQKTS
uniref:Transposase Tc1-like domain-containing protein n=1 Tax=Oncorhynchus tshawytscha TaxID=74940 RepID=A0AAZ3PUM4_ONCTS